MAFIKGALQGNNPASLLAKLTQHSVIPAGFGGEHGSSSLGKSVLGGIKPNLLADHLASAATIGQKGKPGAGSTTPLHTTQGGPTPTLEDPSKAIHGVLKQHG